VKDNVHMYHHVEHWNEESVRNLPRDYSGCIWYSYETLHGGLDRRPQPCKYTALPLRTGEF